MLRWEQVLLACHDVTALLLKSVPVLVRIRDCVREIHTVLAELCCSCNKLHTPPWSKACTVCQHYLLSKTAEISTVAVSKAVFNALEMSLKLTLHSTRRASFGTHPGKKSPERHRTSTQTMTRLFVCRTEPSFMFLGNCRTGANHEKVYYPKLYYQENAIIGCGNTL